MHSALEFLLHHGYAVLLAWVFAEQIGLPVPSLPMLLAAGALAGSGQFNFAGSIFLSVFACMMADFASELHRRFEQQTAQAQRPYAERVPRRE